VKRREQRTRRYGPGPHRRIYLVAPRHPDSFWSLQGTVDLYGARTMMPNAALPTLMSLTPPGVSVEYALGDENVDELSLTTRLYHITANGAVEVAASSDAIDVPAVGPGPYRVEVELTPLHLSAWLPAEQVVPYPWLLSNAITVE